MTNIIKDHPTDPHPFAISLVSNDVITDSGVEHRILKCNEHGDIFLDFMLPA